MAENVIAVITTYNEEATIKRLVQKLSRKMLVIVEDGGSDDDTIEEAYAGGARVGTTYERRPIAECLLDAMRTALDLGADRIVQIDAGGSHQVTDVWTLIDSNADLVIGSRFVEGSRYEGNLKRQVMSRVAAAACNLAVPGASWHDWTSGYRVFSRTAAEHLVQQQYDATMHGFQIEVLVHAARAGFRIEERPITYIAGRSSFNRKVGREAFGVWWRLMKQRENPVNWAKPSSFGGVL